LNIDEKMLDSENELASDNLDYSADNESNKADKVKIP